MYKTGFAAVAAAADAAVLVDGPSPRDPWAAPDVCPELEREVQSLLDDEITIHYGVGSDVAPLVVQLHQARHGCTRFVQ